MGFSDTIPQGSDEPHLEEEQNEGKGGLRRKAAVAANRMLSPTSSTTSAPGRRRRVLSSPTTSDGSSNDSSKSEDNDSSIHLATTTAASACNIIHWPIVRFQHHTQLRLMAPVVTCVCRNRSHTATRRQVPLSLASAFTVHKCQGMTLDRVRASLSQAFGYGMVYVALSRAKSMDQLILSSFDASKVKAHPDVIAFYRSCGCRPPTDSAEDQTEMVGAAGGAPEESQNSPRQDLSQGILVVAAGETRLPATSPLALRMCQENERCQSRPEGGADREFLRRRLGDNGLRLEEVDVSGHCLFDAIANQISRRFPEAVPTGGSSYSYMQVRMDAAGWLRENAGYRISDGSKLSDYLDIGDGADWDIFCDNVEGVGNHRPHEEGPLWGNHLVLIALTECYQRPIRVWTSMSEDQWWIEIEPSNAVPGNIPPFQLAHEHERHYLSVHLQAEDAEVARLLADAAVVRLGGAFKCARACMRTQHVTSCDAHSHPALALTRGRACLQAFIHVHLSGRSWRGANEGLTIVVGRFRDSLNAIGE